MGSARRSAPKVYQVRVALSDVSPPVWRQLRISSGATLSRAVRVIAVALGWPAGRPWLVTREGLRYEGQGSAAGGGRAGAADVRLRQLLHDPGAELELEYGAGHPWHLTVRLAGVLPPNDQLVTPWCEDGGGQAPPIDVGGPWAYEAWRTEGSDGGAEAEAVPVSADGHRAIEPTDVAPHVGRVPMPSFNRAHVNALLERLR